MNSLSNQYGGKKIKFITISIIHYKDNSQVCRFMWREGISECIQYFLKVLVVSP